MNSLARHRLAASGLIVPGLGSRLSDTGVALIAGGWKPPAGLRTSTGLTRVPGSWQGSGTGAALWSLFDITEQYRPLRGPDGALLAFSVGQSVGTTPSGTLRHWCDPGLANACTLQARKNLNDAIAARSVGGLRKVVASVADAYNALGLPWQIDPAARALWRLWLSGPAASSTSEFDASLNWNEDCTTANNFASSALMGGEIPPRVYVGSHFTGTLPAAAYGVFRDCKPAAEIGQFISQFWMGQDIALGVPGLGTRGVGPNRASDLAQSSAQHSQNFATAYPQTFGYVVDAACTRLAPGAAVLPWDAWGYDGDWVGFDAPPLRIAANPSRYVAFLSAWLDALEARSAAEIILDSRNYCMYLNDSTIQANGGTFDRLAGLVASVQLSEWRGDPTASTVVASVRTAAPILGATIAAIAVAAGAAGAASAGIGALVIGSVTAVAILAGALIQPDDSAVLLDDLLRARPVLERGWLDGSPANLTQQGAPTTVSITAPADYSRDTATLYAAPPALSVPTTGSSAPLSTGGKVLAGAAVVGGGLALAQWLDLIDIATWLPKP